MKEYATYNTHASRCDTSDQFRFDGSRNVDEDQISRQNNFKFRQWNIYEVVIMVLRKRRDSSDSVDSA